jgi:thioredoxin-dependent peroxiredoxin
MKTLAGMLIVFLSASIVFAAEEPTMKKLEVGDKAPKFVLKASDGKTYKSEDFLGKQVVVIAWFPKAFTPGCTAECTSFRADGDDMRAFEAAYFTASCDTVEKNTKFAKSLDVDYPILCDPEKKAAKAFGVVSLLRPFPQRWTFYIGTDGKLLAIDKSVKTKTHGQDVAKKLAELKVAKKKEKKE